MHSVPVDPHYGIVIQRESARRLGLTDKALCALLEFDAPLGINESLISFGPTFGAEAASEFRRRLTQAGLEDVDDFYVLDLYLPDWLSLRAEAVQG